MSQTYAERLVEKNLRLILVHVLEGEIDAESDKHTGQTLNAVTKASILRNRINLSGLDESLFSITSPYSSWGQSFDDLVCGPGKICADEWTPVPSRSHSLSPPRHPHSVVSGRTENFRRKSFNDVIDQQPLPIGTTELRSPYRLTSARSRRKGSYYPDERAVRPVTPFPHKAVKPRKKKKKRPSIHRIDTYPQYDPTIQSPPPLAAAAVHHRRSRSRKKQPSSLDNRPPWRDICNIISTYNTNVTVTPRRYQEYLDGGPSNPLPDVVPLRSRSLSPSVPPLKIHKKSVSRQVEQLSAKTYTVSNGSGSGSNVKKFVAPRGKLGEDPPPAFRVRGIPDAPYRRIPTMATVRRK